MCFEKGEKFTERIFGKDGPVLAPHVSSISNLPGMEKYDVPVELPPKDARIRLLHSMASVLKRFSEWQTKGSLFSLKKHSSFPEIEKSFGLKKIVTSFRTTEVLSVSTFISSRISVELPVLIENV